MRTTMSRMLIIRHSEGSTSNSLLLNWNACIWDSFRYIYIYRWIDVVVIVQLLSLVWIFGTPWITACQASVSFNISWSLIQFMSFELVMPSNLLILCCHLLLLPSTFPSIRVFSNESALPIRWPRYWSFSFSISPSNEHSELISFRIDWFNLLAF